MPILTALSVQLSFDHAGQDPIAAFTQLVTSAGKDTISGVNRRLENVA